MFILYFLEQNYDNIDREMIAGSWSLEKLEAKKAELIKLSQEQRDRYIKYNEECTKIREGCFEQVKALVNANKHALLKKKKACVCVGESFDGPIIGSGAFSYDIAELNRYDYQFLREKSKKEDLYYTDDEVIKTLLYDWINFQTIEGCKKYFDMTKLATPLVIEYKLPEIPKNEFSAHYSEETLHIEEIEAI